MKANMTYEEHVKWQLDRAYTGYTENFDVEEVINKFAGIPNEASHILDCQQLKVHKVEDNFAEIFGVEGLSPTTPMELVQLVHPEHQAQVLNLMGAVLANEIHFECGKDSVSQLFRIVNNKMILKTSTPIQMDNNKHATYVVEQHRDVSNLINETFKWSVHGPNEIKLRKLIEGIFSNANPLTAQELTVLSYIGQGLSSKKIGEKLFISSHTVDTHRRNIISKLEVENTTAAYTKAVELGIL